MTTFLATEDPTSLLAMWSEMFLSPEVAYGVLQDVALVAPLVTKAFPLSPVWTTTRCAVTTERLTGVAMVCATSADYNKTYLYSLALAAEVDPGGSFSLSDKQAEVAFKMAKLWKKGRGDGGASAGRAATGVPLPAAGATGPGDVQPDLSGAGAGDLNMEDKNSLADSDEDSEPPPLSWEQADEPLPDDLAQVLQRFQFHGLQVQAKELLDCCPRWSGIKTKAEINNFKNDGLRTQDRTLKMLQQKLLGLQRIYPIIHINLNDNEEAQQLSQKFFTLLLEAEKWVITKRKEASLPGAIIPQDPQLFTQEDLKNDNQNQKFKPTGSSINFSFGKGMSHFPTNTGFTKPKYRGFQGRFGFSGRGMGYRSYGGSYGFGSRPKTEFSGPKGLFSRGNKGKGKYSSPTTSLKRTHSGLRGRNFGTHSGPIGAKDPESFLSIIPNLSKGLSPQGRNMVGDTPLLQRLKVRLE